MKNAVTSQNIPSSIYVDGRQFVPTERTAARVDRVERWYLKPLLDMGGHSGFVCLDLCFPLYERYLRSVGAIKETENFSEGHSVFDKIGKHLGLPSRIAYFVWQDIRNGLLHKAMPDKKGGFNYVLTRDGTAIAEQKPNNEIWINPFLFRDKVVELVRSEPSMWRDDPALAREWKYEDWGAS